MKATWTALVFALVLLAAGTSWAQEPAATGQDNGPVLKTRPHDDTNTSSAYHPAPVVANPNAIPEGTRFLIRLRDTLDTRKMEQGKRFKAELREDLITPSGLIIPRGRNVKAHVARFERGYTGARLQLALDEIDTRHGWVPLIGTVTGVPGDPSIKSTGEEGEITQRGPDKKRVLTNAAIGAGVGAATGAMAGGHKGAAIGAAAGAGLGTGSSWLFKGQDLKLDKGTHLEVRLDRDMTVPAR
jgi:YmgG-like glycine-zipper protein